MGIPVHNADSQTVQPANQAVDLLGMMASFKEGEAKKAIEMVKGAAGLNGRPHDDEEESEFTKKHRKKPKS